MDKIQVSGIAFWANHGVLESEQQQGQRFIVDASFSLDTSHCGDVIERTVHYGEFAQDIVTFCQGKTYRLIETLVNELATHLLCAYPLIQELSLTLHKPNAPIPLHFSDVSITVNRGRTVCYLAIGSNLGDRECYLNSVCEAIETDPQMKLLAQSTYLETKPYGITDQPDFLNGVMKVETIYTPRQLLAFCQTLESRAGRKKTRHWGERTLDVDILLYGNQVMETKELTIPHPQMHLRSFVLRPLHEIAPNLRPPILGKTVSELLQALRDGEEMPHLPKEEMQ